ncbi:hypothetical protein J4218_04060 [Candidatus Pacearchaeota archaeon]|nr:hypothetical protein [Candidatus Pacearchaeota archaeon]
MEDKYKTSTSIIKNLITEGKIKEAIPESKDFFLNKAISSVTLSDRLFRLQDEEDIETNMWIINISYYAMFFAATALLAKYKKKIDSEIGIHIFTYHALVHYFFNEDNKIEKQFIEEYKDAVDEAEELLRISERKSIEFISDFKNELEKRKIFTYNLGSIAEKNKAETSLKRAKNFVRIIEGMIK